MTFNTIFGPILKHSLSQLVKTILMLKLVYDHILILHMIKLMEAEEMLLENLMPWSIHL